MRELLRHLGLTWFLGGVYLRRLMEYRADFLIGTFSFFIAVSVQALTITIVFRQVPAVEGWRYEEALFLLGFSLIPRGLDHLFTDNLWELGRKFVQRGEFFKYLIRPVNPLFYLVSERFFYPDGLGQLLAGISITAYAAGRLDLHLSIVKLAAAVGFVVCGAMIYMAIKLTFASLAFWTVVSLPAMSAVYELASFVKYPFDIYNGAVRMLLTWVIPFAFTAYVPVSICSSTAPTWYSGPQSWPWSAWPRRWSSGKEGWSSTRRPGVERVAAAVVRRWRRV